jgi:hypothetical protein
VATAEAIAEVQLMLGGAVSADENGYTAARIETLLDLGNTANSIAATYWEARYAATSELIDISESGSSRALSVVTKNARDLAEMYRSRATGAAKTSSRIGIRSHRVKRV